MTRFIELLNTSYSRLGKLVITVQPFLTNENAMSFKLGMLNIKVNIKLSGCYNKK